MEFYNRQLNNIALILLIVVYYIIIVNRNQNQADSRMFFDRKISALFNYNMRLGNNDLLCRRLTVVAINGIKTL